MRLKQGEHNAYYSRRKRYLFSFYASDRDEPPHIHAVKGRLKAKVWLQDLSLAYNRGFNAKEISEILTIVKTQQHFFQEAWHEFFA